MQRGEVEVTANVGVTIMRVQALNFTIGLWDEPGRRVLFFHSPDKCMQ
jgi:hypothetical protein